MSVVICRSSAAAGFESILAMSSNFSAAASWLQPQQQPSANVAAVAEENYVNKTIEETEKPPGELELWTSIQAQNMQEKAKKLEEPYVHPLLRRSPSLLNQKSLEICTESLGSETGSDGYFSSDDEEYFFSLNKKEENQTKHVSKYYEEEEQEEYVSKRNGRKELPTVNYHCCSISSRRPSPPRSFPPPLPSISRRDGPCLQMRPHRLDGRLVVEAVPVPSQNYLHAERHNGRLLLSFINTTSTTATVDTNNKNETQHQELKEQPEQQQQEIVAEEMIEETEEQEQEEEEVEVVDRGTVVEVKISTQPPQQNNGCGAAALKVHRSSIVINKFVSCTPIINNNNQQNHHAIPAFSCDPAPIPAVRRLSTTTTTAAAAAVAASSLSASWTVDDSNSSEMMGNKLMLTSRRRRNRDELLHDMRRCNQLRKPLFIWEPCCIATSS